MMSILSILVVMLVQGHMVCGGELFPVSMFTADSGDHQPIDPQEKNELKPLQGSNVAERALSQVWKEEADKEIALMKTNIVDKYKFEKHPKDATWTFQPSFTNALKTDDFKKEAEKVEVFFLKLVKANSANPWGFLQEKLKDEPLNILYVTAARYLLVTDILRLASKKLKVSFGACEELRDTLTDIPLLWKIPAGGVCFPKPYGSATYKSDYDVGLIGEKSGLVTEEFNKYFEMTFGVPSELVFDTNVYAFTLEFAMPAMFRPFPEHFKSDIMQLETKGVYKMQELASALIKVFKYNEVSYGKMKEKVSENLVYKYEVDKDKEKNREKDEKKFKDKNKDKAELIKWLNEFQTFNLEQKKPPRQMALKPNGRNLAKFREDHNMNYEFFVKQVKYDKTATAKLAKALLYAAEAYHTRGAIRHVVQAIQMHAVTACQYYTPISTFDLWVSMIENWGEANKEYQHCGADRTVADCLKKMSKYLSRMFDAMRVIRRSRLLKEDREGLLNFGSISDPELAINLLLRYKKCNEKLSDEVKLLLVRFLKEFECNAEPDKVQKLPAPCLTKIHDAVNAYNIVLAKNVRKISGLMVTE